MIHSLRVFVAGLSGMGRHLGTSFFIYLLNGSLALTVGLPFIGRLQQGFQGSMLPERLLKGFDYTVFTELLRNSAETAAMVLVQARWLVLLNLVLSIFLTGGVLYLIDRRRSFSVRSFFLGVEKFWFRFFRLFLCMSLLHLSAAALVYLPLGLFLKTAAKTVESETTLFFIALGAVVLHLLLLAVLLMVSMYAKIGMVVKGERRVLRQVFRSLAFVLKRFPSVSTLFLLFLIGFVLFTWGWLNILRMVQPVNGWGILLAFGLQQLFVFFRVLFKIWAMDSHYRLFVRLQPPREANGSVQDASIGSKE